MLAFKILGVFFLIMAVVSVMALLLLGIGRPPKGPRKLGTLAIAFALLALTAADASAEIPPRYRIGDRLITAEGSVIEIAEVRPGREGHASYRFVWTESPFLKIDGSEQLVDWFASSSKYVPAGKPMPQFKPARPKYDFIVNGLEVQMYLDGNGPPPLFQWDGSAWQYSPDRKHLPTWKAPKMPWPKEGKSP